MRRGRVDYVIVGMGIWRVFTYVLELWWEGHVEGEIAMGYSRYRNRREDYFVSGCGREGLESAWDSRCLPGLWRSDCCELTNGTVLTVRKERSRGTAVVSH